MDSLLLPRCCVSTKAPPWSRGSRYSLSALGSSNGSLPWPLQASGANFLMPLAWECLLHHLLRLI